MHSPISRPFWSRRTKANSRITYHDRRRPVASIFSALMRRSRRKDYGGRCISEGAIVALHSNLPLLLLSLTDILAQGFLRFEFILIFTLNYRCNLWGTAAMILDKCILPPNTAPIGQWASFSRFLEVPYFCKKNFCGGSWSDLGSDIMIPWLRRTLAPASGISKIKTGASNVKHCIETPGGLAPVS